MFDNLEIVEYQWCHNGHRFLPPEMIVDRYVRTQHQAASPTESIRLTEQPPRTLTTTQAFLSTVASFYVAFSFRPLVFIVTNTGRLYGLGEEYSLLANGHHQNLNDHEKTLPFGPVAIDLPADIGTPSNPIVEISAAEHVLLLSAQGDLVAWGHNRRAQLGLGRNRDQGDYFVDAPVLVQRGGGSGDGDDQTSADTTNSNANSTYISVRAGHYFSLALTAGGRVAAWGSNQFNQTCRRMSRGVDNVPFISRSLSTRRRLIPKLLDIVAIDAGFYFAVALDKTGRLYAWGNWVGNFYIDERVRADADYELKLIHFPGKVRQVSCGHYHALVLLEDGKVFGFGRNDLGQLCLPTKGRRVNVRCREPVRIRMQPSSSVGKRLMRMLNRSQEHKATKTVVAIKACRFIHLSLAQTASNEVYVWGDMDVTISYFERMAINGQGGEFTKESDNKSIDFAPRLLPFITIEEAEIYLLRVYAAIDLELKNVASGFIQRALVDHADSCDVRFTFGTGAKSLQAHSHILRMLSDRWVSMLASHERDDDGQYVIDIAPHTSATVKRYLDFIYTGNFEASRHAELLELDELAAALNDQDLSNRCDEVREALMAIDCKMVHQNANALDSETSPGLINSTFTFVRNQHP